MKTVPSLNVVFTEEQGYLTADVAEAQNLKVKKLVRSGGGGGGVGGGSGVTGCRGRCLRRWRWCYYVCGRHTHCFAREEAFA